MGFQNIKHEVLSISTLLNLAFKIGRILDNPVSEGNNYAEELTETKTVS